jgi:hypothetical protein
MSGDKELMSRRTSLHAAVDVICGIASCTDDDAGTVISTQCLFAAGPHVQDVAKRVEVLQLLRSHRERTGWPHYDLVEELENNWSTV